VFITISQFTVDGDDDAFDDWILPLADRMRALPGNVFYRVWRDPRVPNSRVLTEAWDSEANHLAHLVDPDHVEIIALGSEMGMRDVHVHHWTRAEGHIEKGRPRTEDRQDDTADRAEMYRLVAEFRAARGLPA